MMKSSRRPLPARLLCLTIVAFAVTGCSPDFSYLIPVYEYQGRDYSSAEKALAAQSSDYDLAIAAVRQREKPVAGRAKIVLPSWDYVYDHMPPVSLGIAEPPSVCPHGPRFRFQYLPRLGPVPKCYRVSDFEEMRRYAATARYEHFLFISRAIERSKIFESVHFESYDSDAEVVFDKHDGDVIVFGIIPRRHSALYVIHPKNLPILGYPTKASNTSIRVINWLGALDRCLRYGRVCVGDHRHRTAEAPEGDAQFDLSLKLRSAGRIPEALRWLCMAAHNGSGAAEFSYSIRHQNGWEGLEADVVTAHMWLSRSHKHGFALDRSLANLEARMTSAEIAEAERLAADWQPNPDECNQFIRAAEAEATQN